MNSRSLTSILGVFNTPLNEEQAWAVCYQCAIFAEQIWSMTEERNKIRTATVSRSIEDAQNIPCRGFSGIGSVDICKDGSIKLNNELTSTIVVARTEVELVESIGLVIYQALDYGLDLTEEHQLSGGLEDLIEYMMNDQSLEGDDGDEGIEHDVEDEKGIFDIKKDQISIGGVLERCCTHLQNSMDAQSHYKAVCRAMYEEAIEISSFLAKVSSANESLRVDETASMNHTESGQEELKSADRARLWIHMMHELRQGIQLHTALPNHFQQQSPLDPNAILMEDIKSKRYTLNKTLEKGDIPQCYHQDTRDLMLQFIRSRPALHSVLSRPLPTPLPKPVNPREELLSAIRSEHQLRPTPGSISILDDTQSASESESDRSFSTRKIIKAGLSLHLSDEEDEFTSGLEEKNKVSPSPLSPLSPLVPLTEDQDQPPAKNLARNQTTQLHNIELNSKRNPTNVKCHLSDKLQDKEPYDVQSTAKSTADCLSLTLEEVMHIRNVLTKAELESLIIDPELHAQVDKAKICFTCKSTKFSLFGQWSTKCRFCQRYVCNNCVSKMQIPTDHFESIPVNSLSPGQLSAHDDIFTFETSRSNHQQLGQQRSPSLQRNLVDFLQNLPYGENYMNKTQKAEMLLSEPLSRLKEIARHGATLASNQNDTNDSESDLIRSNTSSPVLHGPTMNVCCDCRFMIHSMISASDSAI